MHTVLCSHHPVGAASDDVAAFEASMLLYIIQMQLLVHHLDLSKTVFV